MMSTWPSSKGAAFPSEGTSNQYYWVNSAINTIGSTGSNTIPRSTQPLVLLRSIKLVLGISENLW